MNPIILIPARMASVRLPNKPLADIAGQPMIVHVWQRAMETGYRVVVACDSEAIVTVITQKGGEAVLTRTDHPSGSDRIFEALEKIDPKGEHNMIINLQGDMPTFDSSLIGRLLAPMSDPDVEIATLAAEIIDEDEKSDPAVVKPVLSFYREHLARALYFTRATAPAGEGALYHHIGIYAYRRDSLRRFVFLPQSALEKREKLEQLRANEAGMRIDVCVVNTVPLGVDTPETLEKARKALS